MTEPKPADNASSGESDATNNVGSSNEQLWRAAADKLRTRVDFTAKALGGVGMTAASAVGIAKIGDLFPVPHQISSWIWFGFAIVGFVALAGAILIVTFRLWSVNKPLIMRADLDAMGNRNEGGGEEISAKEEKEVRVVYQETARLNGVRSLRAYEARSHRLLRIAARTADESDRKELEAQAQQISADIQETFARAALVVIRRRTSNAVRGGQSIAAYALLVVGILLFALGTDYVSSERSEQITIAKNCADAREAGADADTLPEICGPDPPAKELGKTSAAEEQAKAATDLGKRLEQCLALIGTGDEPAGSCDRIAQAMSALVTPP